MKKAPAEVVAEMCRIAQENDLGIVAIELRQVIGDAIATYNFSVAQAAPEKGEDALRWRGNSR